MEVKNIFKVLIGTMVLIVLSSALIEMFNVNTTSYMVNQYLSLAADQTCDLFTQETYKSTTGLAGSINGVNIYAADGTEYNKYKESGVQNDFSTFYYMSSNPSANPDLIWNSLYNGNTNFIRELPKLKSAIESGTSIANLDAGDRLSGLSPIETMYPELASLEYIASGQAASRPSGVQNLTLEEFWTLSEYDSKVVKYNNWLRANTYYTKNYTPVNIGIPYLDSTVANRMFKWQLTQLMSNCNSALIQKNENTASTDGVFDVFVNFKGFAIYTRGARIGTYNEITGGWTEGFTYHACDLNTAAGRQKFNQFTGMSATATGGAIAGLSYKQIDEDDITAKTKISNNVVMVVEVDYEVPVGYIGITPLKEVFNWVFGTDASGSKHTGVQGYKPGYTGIIDGTITYQEQNHEMVRGTIYYTLVR